MCTDRMCRVRSDFCEKSLPHSGHWHRFSPLCTPRIWCLRCSRRPNPPQTSLVTAETRHHHGRNRLNPNPIFFHKGQNTDFIRIFSLNITLIPGCWKKHHHGRSRVAPVYTGGNTSGETRADQSSGSTGRQGVGFTSMVFTDRTLRGIRGILGF